ncbi:MAG: hypothetical protein Q8K71_04100 [Polaromonas sp.]|nr:hypothetical protein [Polaromonas sp.]MDP3753140.1 hypothetical protein [Polaromonas sp.]
MANRQSSRALLWVPLLLLVVGTAMTDPAAGFALIALAGLGAMGAMVLGDRGLKLVGLLLLSLVLGLAGHYWPAAKGHLAKYQERAKSAATTNPASVDTSGTRK